MMETPSDGNTIRIHQRVPVNLYLLIYYCQIALLQLKHDDGKTIRNQTLLQTSNRKWLTQLPNYN